MATKSFTTDLFFNKKSADSLIKALENSTNIKRSAPKSVKEVKDVDTIQLMFNKG